MFGSLILTLLSGIMLLAGAAQFNQFVNHTSLDEQLVLTQNCIDSFEDLDNFFQDHSYTTSIGTYSLGFDSISDFELEIAYPGYSFSSLKYCETNFSSGANPLEINDTSSDAIYSIDLINDATTNSNITSSYAGCGPIAMVGVLDYFSRFIGYSAIIDDDNEQEFATRVFNNCTTYDISFFAQQSAVFMTPWDYMYGFNNLIEDADYSNYIHSNYYWTVIGGRMEQYWNIITESINKGLPVTLMTTNVSGNGLFGGHYTNIYGYEIMRGVDSQNNVIERKFLKAKVNFGYPDGKYCDARILNDPLIGLVTYDISTGITKTMYASDTANVFVNANGGGQYFFDTRMADVSVGGYNFTTYRLRTSYIENQYLVMSPNRVGAGEAFLQIYPLGRIQYLKFDAGMWGYYEGIENETFSVEVQFGNTYKTIVSYDLSQIGWKGNMMTHHTVLLPPNSYNVRFRAIHSNPIATTNKGRICLENIQFIYGGTFNS